MAVTRAKEKLFMSFPKMRMKFNEATYRQKSSFIAEMPEEIIEPVVISEKIDAKKSLENLLAKWNKDK